MDEIDPAVSRLGPPGSSAPLRCGRSRLPAGAVQRGFTTRQYAVCWVAAGSGSYRGGDGRIRRLTAGDAFERLPGIPHDVAALSGLVLWYVAVPAPALAALHQAGLPRRGPVLRPGERRWEQRFAGLARRLRAAADADLPARLAEMLALIADLHRAAVPADLPHGRAIAAACRHLAADPARRWSAAGLAAMVGLGTHAFRKAFAAHHGCGPLAWGLRRRLEAAQDLLADPRLAIAEVARRMGYDDPLQFSAIFRRHCGCPPSRWRAG